MRVGDLQSRLVAGNVPGREQCMTVRVYDKRTQRGLPLVTLAFPTREQTAGTD
jgi:hypothetical protein